VLDQNGEPIKDATVTIRNVTINLDIQDATFEFELGNVNNKVITSADYDETLLENQDVDINLKITEDPTDNNGEVIINMSRIDGSDGHSVTLAEIDVEVGGEKFEGLDLRDKGMKYNWITN